MLIVAGSISDAPMPSMIASPITSDGTPVESDAISEPSAEQRGTDDEHAPRPEDVAEPPADDEQCREGEAVAGDDPLQARQRGVELAQDRRDGDVQHCAVEAGDQHRGEHDAQGDPAARVRPRTWSSTPGLPSGMSFRYYTEYDSGSQTGAWRLGGGGVARLPPARCAPTRAVIGSGCSTPPGSSSQRLRRAVDGADRPRRRGGRRHDVSQLAQPLRLVEEVYRDDLAGLAALADAARGGAGAVDALEQWLRVSTGSRAGKRGMLAELARSFDASRAPYRARTPSDRGGERCSSPRSRRSGARRPDRGRPHSAREGIVLPPQRSFRRRYLLDVVLDGIRV